MTFPIMRSLIDNKRKYGLCEGKNVTLHKINSEAKGQDILNYTILKIARKYIYFKEDMKIRYNIQKERLEERFYSEWLNCTDYDIQFPKNEYI